MKYLQWRIKYSLLDTNNSQIKPLNDFKPIIVQEPATKKINTFYEKVLTASLIRLNEEILEMAIWQLSVGAFGSYSLPKG